jgi:hypothetical protein
MNDPTITCPNCKTEIRLTESLAAPLIESTRRQYEKRIAYWALAAGLDPTSFKLICETLVKEAHDFDDRMQKAGLLR